MADVSFGDMLRARRRYLGASGVEIDRRLETRRRYHGLRKRAESVPVRRLFSDEMVQIARAYRLDLVDLAMLHASELDEEVTLIRMGRRGVALAGQVVQAREQALRWLCGA